MKRTYTPRRSSAEWKRLVDQHQQSALSATEFFRKRRLPYVQFCKWRSRLSVSADTVPLQAIESNSPTFIDLGQFSSSQASGWEITLHLGDGVMLQLRRR